MKILISNDDGIRAIGIKVLYDMLVAMGHEVHTIAPEAQRSGTSNSITLSVPLIPRKVYDNDKFIGLAINGFPADCVRLGLMDLFKDIDVVVTGINLGLNAGPAIYYSGTVAGAFEGYLLGKRCFALSFDSFQETAMKGVGERFAPHFEKILKKCTKNILYNINIPNSENIKGIQITRQALSRFQDEYKKRKDYFGREYYWIKGNGCSAEIFSSSSKIPTDLEALENGYISLTPLQFDLTNHNLLNNMEKVFENDLG